MTADIRAQIAAEQIQAAKRADILTLLPGLRPHARTSGGELHGPCPLCGGSDRLIAWPAHPKGARARCRQCHPATMDAIALVQWLGKANSFPAAVDYLAGPGARAHLQTTPPPLMVPEPPRPYRPPAAGQRIVARYRYYTPDVPLVTLADLAHDPAGILAAYDAQPPRPRLLYIKERREPGPRGKKKTFYHAHPRPGVTAPHLAQPGDWYEGRGAPARLWPYNWHAALTLPTGAPLLWVDGEKDVRTAAAAGLCAVCGPDGGGSWQEHWGSLFYGLQAIIIPDNDPHGDGQAQAERAARLIAPYADRVKLMCVPSGKDLTDWYNTLIGASHVA